ncbi:MAG: proline--tRNA ligase [Candidatus Paceibacterota bacterium]
MKLSELKIKTKRKVSEETKGFSFLIQANFIDRVTSGIYSYLPLGYRVIKKIEKIVREEIEKIKGQEILMPALHPKSLWEKTNRWETFDALFKVQSKYGPWYALGPTHEEVVTPLAKNFIFSYKDLPFYVYQIQTKFRDEPRPKGGLMRTREFIMKDLYSFHKDEKDLENYYEKVKRAYQKIFKRCGLKPIIVEASGGTFSPYSHEFQVITKIGEDKIKYCPKCLIGFNEELKRKEKNCSFCGNPLIEAEAAEVGNIFKLKDKYSRSLDLKFIDKDGQEKYVIMGCYGIGISRILSVLSEVFSDDKGLVFPLEVAPFEFIILPLLTGKKPQETKIKKRAEEIYRFLLENNKEVLLDDRLLNAGEKFYDADLLGIPYRIIFSEKTVRNNELEIKNRQKGKVKLIKIKEFKNIILKNGILF